MVFDLMRLSHVSPDAQSYHHLIARHAHFQNLEAALLQLEKLDSSELTPLVDSLNTLALTALDLGEVKIAHDLALRAESRYDTLLPTSTWLQLIEAAAGASFVSLTPLHLPSTSADTSSSFLPFSTASTAWPAATLPKASFSTSWLWQGAMPSPSSRNSASTSSKPKTLYCRSTTLRLSSRHSVLPVISNRR